MCIRDRPSTISTVSGIVFLKSSYCASKLGTSWGNWGRYAPVSYTHLLVIQASAIGTLRKGILKFCPTGTADDLFNCGICHTNPHIFPQPAHFGLPVQSCLLFTIIINIQHKNDTCNAESLFAHILRFLSLSCKINSVEKPARSSKLRVAERNDDRYV